MVYIPRCPICGAFLENTWEGDWCPECGYLAEREVYDRAVEAERSFDAYIERDEDDEL